MLSNGLVNTVGVNLIHRPIIWFTFSGRRITLFAPACFVDSWSSQAVEFPAAITRSHDGWYILPPRNIFLSLYYPYLLNSCLSRMSLQLSEESLCLSKESSCFPESLGIQIYIYIYIYILWYLQNFRIVLCRAYILSSNKKGLFGGSHLIRELHDRSK